ncbi:glycoside hydrolase family 1 protein [Methylocystis suflitae]|uniref:glycoside hydrolase n=1 Tax=Methylocystis suflitae TaxID=2951405 RepID=UPI00210C0B36|nr:glycoside hydrolase [Methylocystis suflitae]MCQ4190191.1 glycoside hydrolase [Methylocystis suflitae]
MFQSFFLAGFEGSTGFNRHGEWFDQVVATGHDANVDADYADIARLGLHAARETVRWPLVDCRSRYDFSSLEPFIEAANRHGVGVIWDLFHYGFPQDVDLWAEAFPRRFADYCYAVARFVAGRMDSPCVFTPINEPSFMAYAGGEKALFAPYGSGRGWELKVALARGAIAGINAIRAACPDARIVNVDPLCRVVCPKDRPDLAPQAHDFNNRLVFQSWDMLCGRLLPELGGSPEHLDVVGINYYWTNQWELNDTPNDDGNLPPLDDDDPRRAPLPELILSVWKRYGREVMITETSHVGDNRGPWLCEVVSACHALLLQNVPLRGACLYPILGMPEWHDRDLWTPMGLWDPLCHRDPGAGRLLCEPMAEALQGAAPLQALHQAKKAEHRGEPRIDLLTSKAKRYATLR